MSKKIYTWEDLHKDYVHQLKTMSCGQLDKRAEYLRNQIQRECNRNLREEYENRLKCVEELEKNKMCELHLSIEEVKLEKEKRREKGEEARKKIIEKRYVKIDEDVINYLLIHPEIKPLNRMRIMLTIDIKGEKGEREMGEEMIRKSMKRLLESGKVVKNIITEKYEVKESEYKCQ